MTRRIETFVAPKDATPDGISHAHGVLADLQAGHFVKITYKSSNGTPFEELKTQYNAAEETFMSGQTEYGMYLYSQTAINGDMRGTLAIGDLYRDGELDKTYYRERVKTLIEQSIKQYEEPLGDTYGPWLALVNCCNDDYNPDKEAAFIVNVMELKLLLAYILDEESSNFKHGLPRCVNSTERSYKLVLETGNELREWILKKDSYHAKKLLHKYKTAICAAELNAIHYDKDAYPLNEDGYEQSIGAVDHTFEGDEEGLYSYLHDSDRDAGEVAKELIAT